MTAAELQPAAVGDALVVNGNFGAVVAVDYDREVAVVCMCPPVGQRAWFLVTMTTFLAAYLREQLERQAPNEAVHECVFNTPRVRGVVY